VTLRPATPEHEIAYQDVCALVKKHAGNLTAQEVLAVAANMVGKLVALQDQRTTSTDKAMEIVRSNIEYGNQQVILEIEQSRGSA